MNKFLFATCLLFATSFECASQKLAVKVGTAIPLNYHVGLDYQFHDKFSAGLNLGLLTYPYNLAIYSILGAFDIDDAIINTIGGAFNYGLIAQPEIRYHFKKNYFGILYSYYYLSAKETPIDAMQNYYGNNLQDRNTLRNKEFSLGCQLHNAGLLYGRIIPLKNEKMQIRLELSLSKTFASSSKMSTERSLSLTKINEQIQTELNSYFIQYAYLPSINVQWVYLLGKNSTNKK